jgi:ADP-heptose:LPS heptosyltransferase/SAM-dependent methyltransferase
VKTARRQEIDAIQVESLAQLRHSRSIPFWNRAAIRLKNDFFGKPLPEKLPFLRASVRSAVARARARIGGIRGPQWLERKSDDTPLRVAVHGTGSMGDFLTHTMFLEQLHRTHGPINIEFFCDARKLAMARFVLQNARFVTSVAPIEDRPRLSRFDLAVSLGQVPKYDIINHTRLVTQRPRLLEAIRSADERVQPIREMIEAHPLLDGLLARQSGLKGMNAADVLGHFGNLDISRSTIPFLCPSIAAHDAVTRLGLADKPFVTVHDGFDPAFPMTSDRATKCWPLAHWHEFVRLFKGRFPDILVVQVGGALNGCAIEGIDVNLAGSTTLDETAWIIKNALIHIDGESGLVRMARALHTTSVVIFGPTSSSYFAFDRNINLVAEACHDCWWATRAWMSSCPRGLPEPECMPSILPAHVLDAASECLSGSKEPRCELIDAALYDRAGLRESRATTLMELFRVLDLPAVPISEHSRNAATGLYLHASKQWEYLFACVHLDALSAARSRRLKILDIGGGRGALAPFLATQGHDVDVVDLDYQRDHAGDPAAEWRFMQLSAQLGFSVRHGSLFNIPAENESYDVVASMSVMEHVSHKDSALKEVLRVLKPGGLLILSFDFALEPTANEDHLRIEILGPDRLSKLLGRFGVDSDPFSARDVHRSVGHIQADQVLGIPEGMTVGAVALRKLQ